MHSAATSSTLRAVQTFYGILADAILLLHALIVLFIVGALPVIWLGRLRHWRFVRNFAFRLFHLALIGFVAAESICGEICPLTTWESELRAKSGSSLQYDGGFIAYWVHRALFYDFSQTVFTTAYIFFFVLVLLTFIWVRPRRPVRWRRSRPSP